MVVLAIPVINRPDLLARCLQSIDYPVDLLVIDNSRNGFAAELIVEYYTGEFFVTEPPANLGVAASWNLAIRTHPHDPFWLIANADTEFGPGDIGRMVEEMQKPGPRWVGVECDWRLMGLSAEVVDEIGFFDEGFHPIYLEDCDYERRCALGNIPWYFIPGTSTHVGSAAIRSDERLMQRNAQTYPANVRRYIEKWGGAQRGGETFLTPWNRGGDLSEWSVPLSTYRDQAW